MNLKRPPSPTPRAQIGIIGGSGLYQMDGFTNLKEVRMTTPFGKPSDAIILGTFHGMRVAFLARHGRGHRTLPSAINYRANIHALKSLGVTKIFSVSAVGSMKESIRPGDFVLPDQFIDRTTQRNNTFFDQGIVAHVAFADPICGTLSSVLEKASLEVPVKVHRPGTYLCIEGPQFSSRAESLLYRQWGVDVIGMTNIPEAKLAREAELCYATLALVTDYDCWHETEDAVSVGAILSIMHRNVETAKLVLQHALEIVKDLGTCSCQTALEYAVITPLNRISPTLRKRYQLLLKRHLSTTIHTKKRS
ncbi:MAG TPA: S-methyl-5'-thioadenosine phosphorylase [Nitrospirales bacterium]|nr:S-methyl-5'-thioadenosine phosphorylase [Nitrospirales bacterium]